ncbi:MAG TPA: FecR domain-containing protein [Pyrinomonadaceae bacterium]
MAKDLPMLHIAFSSLITIAILLFGLQQEPLEGFMTGIRANAVKGEVVYQHEDGKFDLEPGLKLEEGDFIRTGVDSYAELLLQPGNYLRLGGETECQIVSDQHDDKMRLKLNHGAISLEILARSFSDFYYSSDQINELIRVITPNAEVFITRQGIFRINVTAGRTEVIARGGDAVINGRRVKEKHRAVAANGSVMVTEVDSKLEDNFDAWARERAAKLVHANKLLQNEAPWSKRQKDEEPSVEMPEDSKETNDHGRVISAKPGAVNFVEDGVEFTRASQDWQQLTEKSQLETGDTLRTGANSFVELVLFPDMHLRLDASSELRLAQLSNDSTSIKLLRGSAIVDVARFDKKQSPQITIASPSTSVAIAGDGNYRIDGDRITVRYGKVIFSGRCVGSCRRIERGTVSECDKNARDNFDFWSEHRGEGELYNGRGTVAMGTQLAQVRRERFRNTGFWLQQPGQTSYTFVPFTSSLFRSPYGGSYSTVLSPRRIPNRVDAGGRPSFPSGHVMRPRP